MDFWTGVAIFLAVSAFTGFFSLRVISRPPNPSSYPKYDEPELIRKNTTREQVRGKSLRVFRSVHPKGNRVPFIVFVHGLGGTIGQFAGQLDYFSRAANLLSYDYVGHGESEGVEDFSAYTTQSLLEDLIAILGTLPESTPFVIVAHSYGTALTPLAVNALPRKPHAVVLLGPGNPTTPAESYQKINSLARKTPEWLIEIWRNTMERPGGLESASVKRFLSKKATKEMKIKQWAWNEMSRTPTLKRMMAGVDFSGLVSALTRLEPPVLLIAGAEDTVTPPENAEKIRDMLARGKCKAVAGPLVLEEGSHNMMVDSEREVNQAIRDFLCSKDFVGLGDYFVHLM